MVVELNDLYNFALLVVLIGMVVGAGVLALDKFGQSEGITTNASTAIGSASTAVGDIANTWLSLIVTIVVVALIIAIIARSFGGARR